MLLVVGGPLEAQTSRSAYDNGLPSGFGGDLSGSLGGSTLRPLATTPVQPGTPAAPAAGPVRQDPNAPVTFTADEVDYDRERTTVTARGRVEAWQNERVVRADEFTHNRETGVTRLRGHVQLLEADGQVMFAEDAELAAGFREGVFTDVRALLAGGGRMAANGARRITVPAEEGSDRREDTLTDLARVIYSSCKSCERDPMRAPLWQMRARQATQDTATQRISYRDAALEISGVPVLYSPFFSHPDPQNPRSSGFLFPTMGLTRFLGGFVQVPYFWAIDDQQDATIYPLFSTRQSPNLGLEYRRRFNTGEFQLQGSAGYFNGTDTRGREEFSGHLYARGRFSLDENWRTGFEVNRATSELYLRTYRFDFRRVLTSQAFVEGFWGTEGYARIDARVYQGLRTGDNYDNLPVVGPNAIAEYYPRQRYFGGQLYGDVGMLGITRSSGAWSQRATARIGWDRRETDALGSQWTFRVQGDARAYYADKQGLEPIYLPHANGGNATGNMRVAIDWRMPLVRDAGNWGQQTIEPRVQIVTGPNTGRQSNLPNEDSVDFEFTDANLFSLNRFTGRDRQEGGTRVDAAIRGAWNFPNGGQLEGIVGRSFRVHRDATFAQGTGLERNWSDWVGRVSFMPTSWLDLHARARADGETGQHRFSDYTANVTQRNVGPLDTLSFYGGYLYSTPQSFLTPLRTRNEVLGGVTATLRQTNGVQWRVNASIRYDLETGRPALVQGSAGYEDECFIIEGRFVRRYARDATTLQNYAGGTMLLFRIGFKTLGEYGFRAL
ncbi:LPS-assembly protein LptD [Rhodovarius crocodyli]|uniref:LPS-assembly protein LptD n=2 Tax=Rhodovarius crocodyli TaxID=1979269 RepID=A0A437MHP6_9PROT|nr:LPS-assembly protein LptD [Rhodovarius crocodyli]